MANLEFTERDVTVSLYNTTRDDSYTYSESKATIEWYLYLEARSWGIKDIEPIPTRATFTITKTTYNDDGDEIDEIQEEITVEGDNIERGDNDWTGEIFPTEIEYDYKTKQGKVHFSSGRRY